MPIEVRSLAEWEAAGIPGMLSVVIPAHNEEGHIAETVRELTAALQAAEIRYEILVVNDNSGDGTERILATLNAADPCVRYINNTPPNGFGFAVRRGLVDFRGDAVAIVMADGSDDPVDLVRFDPDTIDRLTARRDLGISDGDHVSTVLAQITPWKGQEEAIRAIARM